VKKEVGVYGPQGSPSWQWVGMSHDLTAIVKDTWGVLSSGNGVY
jgi:hypothetical protein